MNFFKNNKIIFIYFIYISLATIFFLKSQTIHFPTKYTYTEWLINYEGGFIRRGLLGQVVYELSNFFKVSIVTIILYFQITAYLCYYFIFIYLFTKLELNFFWVIFIFSSISFLYPLGELESLGRKEIFVLLSFIIFSLIKPANIKNLFVIFFIFFGISNLIHEITFFYIHYYFLIIYLKSKMHIKKIIHIRYYVFTFLFICFLIYLNSYLGQLAKIDEIVNSYLKLNIIVHSDLGAIGWLSKSFKWALLNTINKISIMGILRYLYILLIYLIPILYFIKIKKNKLNKYISIKNLVFVSLLFSIPIYLLVLDWGRVTYLNYNFLMISIIFLFNNKLVDNSFINIRLNKLSTLKKIIIFSMVNLMWGPKILLTDELGKVPLYKSFTKFLKFFI